MKTNKYKTFFVTILILVFLFVLPVLPASAESNIAALVEEQFTSAQEELGIDELSTISSAQYSYDPSGAYWCTWLSTELFSEEYKEGDSLDTWAHPNNVCIFVPTADGLSGFMEFRYKQDAWTENLGYTYTGLVWQGYQDSYVLRKDALIYALERLELGNVEEIRFYMADWIHYCTLVYVKSDTGEYMIPFGCSKKISLVDGELYTVKEVADAAWRDWYGSSQIAAQKAIAVRIALTVALVAVAVAVPLIVRHRKRRNPM
ncbi:MAG: hypothetical protein IJW40_00710 [Clostridia bacterium]|nr:hypothetical protein [Clostridia bacterium]